MSTNIIQEENLIQDFIDVTVEVLGTMSSFDVSGQQVIEIDASSPAVDLTPCMDITGVLGFSGGRKGSLLVTMTEKIALRVVGGMLGIEFDEVDADVRDGIGELINMIAGGAKTKLQGKGVTFELSIPNTVIGNNHQITAPASTSRTRIIFDTELGPFFLEVYIKEL